ncbi:hypothetical protein K491DRAFT_776939 [Lophiostoma macrostomum CBS 122681]|uniref:Gfd2/YDR514C-like C-terminal domain-containing protein n=1 Tax=Lophiostoma macrostomum CBS 122681 TaxID=1314788 RepID=A0A6A6TDF7_9PLEO|nr:hypothetical protein K491DRAFT_776939 [Lophiostoma macrostomum CBS 122681]
MGVQRSSSLLPLPIYMERIPSQLRILQHFLGRRLPYAPHALEDAVFVGLDAEWFERGSKDITELGFSILDSRNITTSLYSQEGIWGALQHMQVKHIRLRETAHMVNTKLCPGRPDKFAFGETRFVHMDEARNILQEAFIHPINEYGSGNRPVIFIGHAVDNDIEMMKQHFGIDLNDLGTIVATLDTQILAQEAHLCPNWKKMCLKDLLRVFGLCEKYLHTAGNDIAYTMIAALLTATFDMQEDASWLGDAMAGQTHVEYLKEEIAAQPQPSFGISTFCTRCDATDHFVPDCTLPVHCDKCAEATTRARHAHTHKTSKCGIVDKPQTPELPSPPVVIPCLYCLESTEERRWKKAHTHLTEACGFAMQMQMQQEAYAYGSAVYCPVLMDFQIPYGGLGYFNVLPIS